MCETLCFPPVPLPGQSLHIQILPPPLLLPPSQSPSEGTSTWTPSWRPPHPYRAPQDSGLGNLQDTAKDEKCHQSGGDKHPGRRGGGGGSRITVRGGGGRRRRRQLHTWTPQGLKGSQRGQRRGDPTSRLPGGQPRHPGGRRSCRAPKKSTTAVKRPRFPPSIHPSLPVLHSCSPSTFLERRCTVHQGPLVALGGNHGRQ